MYEGLMIWFGFRKFGREWLRQEPDPLPQWFLSYVSLEIDVVSKEQLSVVAIMVDWCFTSSCTIHLWIVGFHVGRYCFEGERPLLRNCHQRIVGFHVGRSRIQGTRPLFQHRPSVNRRFSCRTLIGGMQTVGQIITNEVGSDSSACRFHWSAMICLIISKE